MLADLTGVQVYNTLTRKKEILKSQNDLRLNIFVCGLTVYDYAHIGHAKTYVAFDVIAKYLQSLGFSVFYLQNITDIDDKIINRAIQRGVDTKKLALHFEKEFLDDMKELGVTSVSEYARATEYIDEIIGQVTRLVERGHAYLIDEEGVYFNISTFAEYGKLSGRTVVQAEDAISKIDDSVKKINRGDFALWKLAKPHEPSWESPWGAGRPGWHIEDTAITENFFGAQYDIHGGAKDLIFPHHEAEIAQMESISNKKPLARYWLHAGFLTIEGKKMSKSLNNFLTIRDFINQYSPRLLRQMMAKHHYRAPLNYTDNFIEQSKSELRRIDAFVEKLRTIHDTQTEASSAASAEVLNMVSATRRNFSNAMNDDFNTPKAFASILYLIKHGNTLIDKEGLSMKDADVILESLHYFDASFGFILQTLEEIPDTVKALLALREQHRTNQDWSSADKVREKIEALGWIIEDTPEGARAVKKT